MTHRAKSCPKCSEVMSRFSVFGVGLDQCPRCHGLWFDSQELDAIKSAMDDDIRWKDFDLQTYAERAHFKHTDFACPACSGALCALLFDTSRIELEFCARCGGVWADQGKLAPILEHMRTSVNAEPLRQVEKEALHQFLEIFIGRKGPWEEIKDFAAAWRLLSLKFAIDHPALMGRLDVARRALPF